MPKKCHVDVAILEVLGIGLGFSWYSGMLLDY